MRIAALFYACVLPVITQALHPIVIKGHKFFDAVTKAQFYVKGVAYQPRSNNVLIDPLADPSACARDASLMAKLGLNVVRVYETDPKKSHDECMKIFADAGLYVLLDIASTKFSINRQKPEYDVRLYNAYKATIDAFAKYDNVLAFIAGNEVTNDKTNTQASAYVKAIIRDIKHYIRTTKKRVIPVGYASNDDEFIRDAIKDYFNCGDDASQADFFGANLYEWCGESSFETSGYRERTQEFETYSKPVFLTEYGCNLVSPRPFTEVDALYSASMTDVWSGGVVYEWTQENNNYGLVQLHANDTKKVELLQDYTNLQNALARISPKVLHMDAFEIDAARQAAACPSYASEYWKASADLPPTPSEGACECMRQNIPCIASDKVTNTNEMNTAGNTTNALGAQIDLMCGLVSCADISGHPQEGSYGAYSFCTPKEKLSWLYHLYAQDHKGVCDFDGYATKIVPKRKDLMTCSHIEASTGSPGDASASPTKNMSTRNGPSLLAVAIGALAAHVWIP